MVAADGYPHEYDKGFIIEGLNDLGDDLVFHAGTSLNSSNQFVTSGGRVLNVTSLSDELLKARENSLINIRELNWSHGFFRKDIGEKIIKNK